MSTGLRIVAIITIAVFAVTAMAAVPMFALFDAQTPVDDLFSAVVSFPVPPVDAVALPQAPAVDVRTPRAPPLS